MALHIPPFAFDDQYKLVRALENGLEWCKYTAGTFSLLS